MRDEREKTEDACDPPAKEAAAAFLKERICSITAFGNGHINETFVVKTEKDRFICQRIRSKMDITRLEHNYLLYSGAFDRAGLRYPVWMQTERKEYFYPDAGGAHWRMYPLIEGEEKEAPLTEEALRSCGQGLAKMHRVLQTLKGKPLAVYPMLHDLKYYHDEYLRGIGNALSAEAREPALEAWIEKKAGGLLKLETDRSAVIHGDPKLANILFCGDTVRAFLDLDTVMQGSIEEDAVDCIRSCCVRDGKPDRDAIRIFMDAYRNEAPELLKDTDGERLMLLLRRIYFELGLRYYTDAVAEEKHFKEKYPGYLKEKAEKYLAASAAEIRI